METEGLLAPETVAEARDAYRTVGPAAQTVVRETARSMDFDRAEYRDRVTGEVVETARDALFASLLSVRVGTREEYEAWREGYEGTVHETGSSKVDRVVWHAPPFADEAVAATFASERDAAAATLRRQAFGRLYRDRLSPGEAGDHGADAPGEAAADAGEPERSSEAPRDDADDARDDADDARDDADDP